MRAQFGKGIDPRIGLIDYSGIARAAEIRARNNRMREEDEERKRQQKFAAIGDLITTFKKISDDNKKIDTASKDLYNKLDSDDPADIRTLDYYGINKGTFGDMDDEQKMETIKETLKSIGVEGITDLENARRLSELKLSQDIAKSRAEYESLISFGGMGAGGDKAVPTFNTVDLSNIENSDVYEDLSADSKAALNALKTGTQADGTPIKNANMVYDKISQEVRELEDLAEKQDKIETESKARTEGLGNLFKGTGSFTGKSNPASYY